MICTKYGSIRFNSWSRCMDCRNGRAKVRTERIKSNGGSHMRVQWQSLLALSPTCAACGRLWSDIPARPDPRYKYTLTKGHKVPYFHGGSDDIENFQAECYECNFKKTARVLGAKFTAAAKHSPAHKIGSTMATSPDKISRIFFIEQRHEGDTRSNGAARCRNHCVQGVPWRRERQHARSELGSR
jgi:hypothetical protein